MPAFLEEKKGQFSIEYLIAFILFSVIILYISFEAAGTVPEVLVERVGSRKDSEAIRIADLLATGAMEGGFAEEPYLWDKSELEDFQQKCENNYDEKMEDLGLDDLSDTRIVRYEEGDPDEIDVCVERRAPSGVPLGRSAVYGYVEGEGMSKLEVTVW
ncbi:MAG: hypothetical protein ACLFTQ_01865 [Candidatus Aenigmatarchaeota archaeon]